LYEFHHCGAAYCTEFIIIRKAVSAQKNREETIALFPVGLRSSIKMLLFTTAHKSIVVISGANMGLTFSSIKNYVTALLYTSSDKDDLTIRISVVNDFFEPCYQGGRH